MQRVIDHKSALEYLVNNLHLIGIYNNNIFDIEIDENFNSVFEGRECDMIIFHKKDGEESVSKEGRMVTLIELKHGYFPHTFFDAVHQIQNTEAKYTIPVLNCTTSKKIVAYYSRYAPKYIFRVIRDEEIRALSKFDEHKVKLLSLEKKSDFLVNTEEKLYRNNSLVLEDSKDFVKWSSLFLSVKYEKTKVTNDIINSVNQIEYN
jgi:hypothetical protein